MSFSYSKKVFRYLKIGRLNGFGLKKRYDFYILRNADSCIFFYPIAKIKTIKIRTHVQNSQSLRSPKHLIRFSIILRGIKCKKM